MRSLLILLFLASPLTATDPPAAPVVAKLGSLERKLLEHSTAIHLHPDNRHASVLSRDGALSTWNLQDGSRASQDQIVPRRAEAVRGGSFTADGRWLYAWDEMNGLIQYDTRAKTHKVVLDYTAVLKRDAEQYLDTIRIVVSADGRTLAAHTEVLRPDDKPEYLTVWDVRDGVPKQIHRVASDASFPLAVPHDGRWIARTKARRANGEVVSWAVEILDTRTGNPIRTFAESKTVFWISAVTPDGDKLLTFNESDGTHVWDTATGKLLREWKPPVGGSRAIFTPDGRGVLLGARHDHESFYHLGDIATGDVIHKFPTDYSWLGDAGFTPDGQTQVTVGYDRTVRIWDVATAKERFPVVGHAGGVTAVAWLPDGTGVVSGGNDGTVRVWRLSDRGEAARLPALPPREEHYRGVYNVVVSRDSSTIAVGQWQYGVRLWDRASGRVSSISADVMFPTTKKFKEIAPSMPYVHRLTSDGEPNVWRVSDENFNIVRLSAGAKVLGPPVAMPKEIGKGENALIRNDPTVSLEAGLGVAYYEGDDFDELRAWDYLKKEVRASVRLAAGSRPIVLSLAPNGRLVVMSVPGKTTHAQSFRVCAVEAFQELGHFHVENSVLSYPECHFSRDSRLCAVQVDHTAPRFQIFDVARFTPLATVTHEGRETPFAFSPDSRGVATGGQDSRIFIHDLRAAVDPAPPKALDAAACWADLVAADGATAMRAVYRLADYPADAVKLFREKLKPAAKPTAEDLTAWLKALNAPAFAERQAATKKLTAVADAIEPELKLEAAKNASPETVEAIGTMLETVARARRKLEGDYLRAYRVVQVLEMIGPPGAELLKEYASGAKGAFLTQEAEAACGRGK